VYGLGQVVLTAATTTSAFTNSLYDTRSKKNRRNHFNDCCGFILFVAFLWRAAAEILTYAVALEYANIALTAIKDNALFQHSNAFNFL
jgi:hypothetical protein